MFYLFFFCLFILVYLNIIELLINYHIFIFYFLFLVSLMFSTYSFYTKYAQAITYVYINVYWVLFFSLNITVSMFFYFIAFNVTYNFWCF